jgi:cell division protein FtsW
MKQQYLPESHTDFIMANVGEELGFVTMMLILLCYLILIGSAMWISTLASDRMGTLIGFGVAFSIGVHAFMNLCVISGAMPTTGVTAPFVSYGGSSMLVTWIGLGILASVVRVSNKEDKVGDEKTENSEEDSELICL